MENNSWQEHTTAVNVEVTGNLAGALSEKAKGKISCCLKCGTKYVPDFRSTFLSGAKKGQWDEHTYKGNCEHVPKTARVSIG